jgi:hypothetical protein
MSRAIPDLQYRPFSPFEEWQGVGLGDAWKDYLSALDEARKEADPQVVDAAVDIALRSAALETGAIEGLYTTNRGITRSVALQGLLWETELAKLGEEVRGHFEAQLAAFDLVLDAATKRSSPEILTQPHLGFSRMEGAYRSVRECQQSCGHWGYAPRP